jgi:tetratricopeptide (TPR) repeat protein
MTFLARIVLAFTLITVAMASGTTSLAQAAPKKKDTVVSLEAKLKKQPQDKDSRKKLGQMYMAKKEYKKAVDLLGPYSNEIDTEALVVLSEAYTALNDHLNAIRTLQMFEQKEPNRFRPYYLLGESFRKNKQPTEAVENYRKAISFAPQHMPSYNGILEIAIEAKDQYESRTILGQMLVTFGPKPELLNKQCQLMSEGGFLAEAEKSCRKAMSLSRNTPENHIYLAQSLDNQDRKQAAENVYRNAARQFSKSEFVQFAAGEFYFYQKNFPTAVRYLSAAVKIKSDSARSQLALAQSLYESNDFKKALVHFEQACKLDKTKVAYNELRSAVAKLYKANRNDLASDYDKKAATCY